ncbi:hypothetical protein [Cupriavidus sp. 8B]
MRIFHFQFLFNRVLAGFSVGMMLTASAMAQVPDFSGIWMPAEQKLVVRPDMNNPPYTPRARAELAFLKENFDPKVSDPGLFCYPNGMPWLVATRAPFPVEILQENNRLFMLFEAHSAVRRIFMDGRKMPADYVPSQEGYSTAKWEGKTLVIETVGLSDRGSYVLLKRSEKARVIERWTLINHPQYGKAIEIKMVMNDSENYLEPRSSYQLLKKAPENTVFAEYDCAGSNFWEPHVQKRLQEIEKQTGTKSK